MGRIKREELENIISEELSKLDEGFLSRILAKAKGNVSGLQALGKNIGQVYNMVAKGENPTALQNPKIAKALKMGSSRIEEYKGKLSKLFVDFASDMKLMFGENFENMPPEIKKQMNVWGEDVKEVLELTVEISNAVEESLSIQNQPVNIPQNQRTAKPRYNGQNDQGRPFSE